MLYLKPIFFKRTVPLYFLFFSGNILFAQQSGSTSDEQLIDQYIQSAGSGTIIFDSSNVKQFWIEKNVVSNDGSIKIIPTLRNSGFDNPPLKIQLANVNETWDCEVKIVSQTKDVKYQILNNASKVLSSSQKEEDFMNYSVNFSVFHLEDTPASSFAIKFLSNSGETISIKKIALSFSPNKASNFLASPGELKITGDSIETKSKVSKGNGDSFSVTGTHSVIFSSKKIYVTDDNTLSSSLTVKNTGENTINVYIGYDVYGKDLNPLKGNNYPFRGNKAVNVITAPAGNSSIIVDSYSDWIKGSFVALNAKDDLSDLPNSSFLDGRVAEIKKLENGQAEIVLNKPLLSELKPGSKIRIHGTEGAYLYMRKKMMGPDEEETFTTTIKKDDSALEYSSKALPNGAYFVIPLILSYSVDPKIENTVLIRDFAINY